MDPKDILPAILPPLVNAVLHQVGVFLKREEIVTEAEWAAIHPRASAKIVRALFDLFDDDKAKPLVK